MAGTGTVPPLAQLRAEERHPDGAASGWIVAASALWVVLLFDVVRVWLPSVLHLAGPAPPDRSPLLLSLVALSSVLLPLPCTLLFRRVPPARVWVGSVVALAAVRVALQAVDGGQPQLWLSAAGVATAVLALAALAAGVPSGHLARLGILVGLAVAAGGHALLGTLDLAWRGGVGPAAAVLVVASAAAIAATRARAVPLWWPTPMGTSGELAPVWTRGPAWPWLIVGPAVALVGMLVAVPARLELAVAASPTVAAAATVGAGGLAVIAAVLAPRLGGPFAGSAGAGGVMLATVAALLPSGPVAAVAQLGVLVALGAVVGALGRTPGDSGPRRRGAAAVASALGFWAIIVAYFASFEIRVGVSNRVWVVAAAGVVALLGGAAAWTSRGVRSDPQPVRRTLVAVVAATALVGSVAPAAVPRLAEPGPNGPAVSTLRVATYNVGSGYGTDGRFDPDALADVLRTAEVDVVVLNEVDRGWLLEGGHDLLRLLADRVDLPHTAFAPAADVVWGNAILSRLPLEDVRSERLPRGGAPMLRSWVSATVDLGDAGRLGVVGTQFHPVPADVSVRTAQARALAAEASRLRGRDIPVVVLGDLGAEPDAPELEPLSFLRDAAPGAGATVPADAPVLRPDQILTTPDLSARDALVPVATAARHRPVVVTLHLDR